MILITVGGQMPFDRLVQTVDKWAATHRDTQCFAQIGPGGWRPKHMEWVEFLPPPVFREKLENASLVVAHAGMGTILSALDLGKRLIILPRLGRLRETRNDHQVATAKRLEAMGLVVHAADENQLLAKLAEPNRTEPRRSTSSFASPQLINAVRTFILTPNAVLHPKDANGNT